MECERCHQERPINDFMGIKRIQVWCKECRGIDPVESKKATDRHYQRQKTHEENQARYRDRREKHPQRKHRTETELADTACSLLIEAVKAYDVDISKYCKQKEYTRGQIHAVHAYMSEIISFIEELNSQHVSVSELRTILNKIQDIADILK